jgi:hypothetical protein
MSALEAIAQQNINDGDQDAGENDDQRPGSEPTRAIQGMFLARCVKRY